jgi:hypothetical protein
VNKEPKMAFPIPMEDMFDVGMNLRDYFAAQALPAVIMKCGPAECASSVGETMEQMFARKAYGVADAMMKAGGYECDK